VCGRSPLEYLGSEERTWQAAAVQRMIRIAPNEISVMVDLFGKELACR